MFSQPVMSRLIKSEMRKQKLIAYVVKDQAYTCNICNPQLNNIVSRHIGMHVQRKHRAEYERIKQMVLEEWKTDMNNQKVRNIEHTFLHNHENIQV